MHPHFFLRELQGNDESSKVKTVCHCAGLNGSGPHIDAAIFMDFLPQILELEDRFWICKVCCFR